ncbi:hypothetical protein BPAE_0343g00050 [Botrytis paeoniae]|uniref:Uncharacterized protein n=1 Tax=Botrytis paeoniae TaxID=278948 RepID=A0A4Z1F6M3_9HELO|nr:hypothetical protein BPAE_0343g00050 [Botrytis paeoniae]
MPIPDGWLYKSRPLKQMTTASPSRRDSRSMMKPKEKSAFRKVLRTLDENIDEQKNTRFILNAFIERLEEKGECKHDWKESEVKKELKDWGWDYRRKWKVDRDNKQKTLGKDDAMSNPGSESDKDKGGEGEEGEEGEGGEEQA